MLLRFMYTVSELYQGLRPSFPQPVLIKHQFPTPDPSLISKYLSVMPHLKLPDSEHSDKITTPYQAVARLDWRVSKIQLDSLRRGMESLQPSLSPSLQDCLTAYIVTVLNRYAAASVRKMTNAASVRHLYADALKNLPSYLQPLVPFNRRFLCSS